MKRRQFGHATFAVERMVQAICEAHRTAKLQGKLISDLCVDDSAMEG
jgi:hypothetical protein